MREILAVGFLLVACDAGEATRAQTADVTVADAAPDATAAHADAAPDAPPTIYAAPLTAPTKTWRTTKSCDEQCQETGGQCVSACWTAGVAADPDAIGYAVFYEDGTTPVTNFTCTDQTTDPATNPRQCCCEK